MNRIETRTQLIEFICKNVGQRVIARACHEGKVVVAGGFERISPSLLPGWITVITSKTGRVWIIAVLTDDFQQQYRATVVKEIPWGYYAGRSGRAGYSIYDGDMPDQAELARDRNAGP